MSAEQKTARRTGLPGWMRRHYGSLLCVGLPTALAALYFFVIAADLYASEASYVVRSPSSVQMGGLAGLLQGNTSAGGPQDAYTVQVFATSRDAMTQLAKALDLKAMFNRPEADFLSRYPNLVYWDNAEDFHSYYKQRITVVHDTTTGISTLTVKAFRAEDAEAIANGLLHLSEQLVNRLNRRARDNAVQDAEAEVAAAEALLSEAQKDVLAYRTRESLIDPGKSSGAIFEAQARTEAELTSARTRLAELIRSSPQSPLRADLESHIRALEQQLAGQRARLTGGDTAMAPKLSAYEQLSLRQDFVTKKLASALTSLEAARAEARRQQIYLERVVEVNRPERARYPRRFNSLLIVFVSAFLIFTIGKLLLLGVREHAQQ